MVFSLASTGNFNRDEKEILSNAIDDYRTLRQQADGTATNLKRIHAGQMVCKKGCCQCCVNLTVFPVEFFSMVDEMKQAGVTKPVFDAAKECGYLNKQGECVIYPYRPIICLTQGLPLAFYDEDTQGYSVTFCQKNFTDTGSERLDFNAENTLNLDELNDKLFEIHLQFLREHPEQCFTEQTRIELNLLGGIYILRKTINK
jgi:Fe-S-cluster containining protein